MYSFTTIGHLSINISYFLIKKIYLCYFYLSVHIYKTYPVLMAAREPLGMLTDGFFKSPLMLIPASMPVIVGKKTPKHLNHV